MVGCVVKLQEVVGGGRGSGLMAPPCVAVVLGIVT